MSVERTQDLIEKIYEDNYSHKRRRTMNKAELIEIIYAEREKIADEQDISEGDDLALLEGWEKALAWVVRQLNQEEESK